MVEQFFNVKELAKQLNVTRQHIYKLLKDGAFPRGCKFGRARRWSETEINEWTHSTAVREEIAGHA